MKLPRKGKGGGGRRKKANSFFIRFDMARKEGERRIRRREICGKKMKKTKGRRGRAKRGREKESANTRKAFLFHEPHFVVFEL